MGTGTAEDIRAFLMTDEFVEDPYPAYTELLESSPLFWGTPRDLLVSARQLCQKVLARAEGPTAVRELLRRLPNLRNAGKAKRDGLYRLRGLAALPVVWAA
jgi:hypothetical protein